MSAPAGDVAVDMSPENLSKLKKDELKNACRGRGLPVSGNKSDLVQEEFFLCCTVCYLLSLSH